MSPATGSIARRSDTEAELPLSALLALATTGFTATATATEPRPSSPLHWRGARAPPDLGRPAGNRLRLRLAVGRPAADRLDTRLRTAAAEASGEGVDLANAMVTTAWNVAIARGVFLGACC